MTHRRKPIGPFAEVEQRVGDFSYNLFSSYLMMESIDRLQQVTQEYADALNGHDEIEIINKKREFDACEASFYIAAHIMQHNDIYE